MWFYSQAMKQTLTVIKAHLAAWYKSVWDAAKDSALLNLFILEVF